MADVAVGLDIGGTKLLGGLGFAEYVEDNLLTSSEVFAWDRVMLAAKRSAAEGRVVEIESTFPDLHYGSLGDASDDHRRQHDPRST